jgi:hypothetical protein
MNRCIRYISSVRGKSGQDCSIDEKTLWYEVEFHVGLNIITVLVVTCIIMQKNGAGMITATSCFWDRDSDCK